MMKKGLKWKRPRFFEVAICLVFLIQAGYVIRNNSYNNVAIVTTTASTSSSDQKEEEENVPNHSGTCLSIQLDGSINNREIVKYNSSSSSRSDDDNSTQSQLSQSQQSQSEQSQLLLFELVVPPVRFLWLEVQPIVYAVVTQEKDRVIISSDQCILEGSPFISKVHLNERFDFCVTAELMWNDTSSTTTTTSNVPASSSLTSDAAAEVVTVDSSKIFAIANIEINVDVPRPFSAIPKRVIVPTGEKAMQVTLNYLLGSFLQGLAQDYQLWANDSNYRQQRRRESSKLVDVAHEEEILPIL